MAIELNHTIVQAHDKHASARFLTDFLGLAEPETVGPFSAVALSNGVTLDYMDTDAEIVSQHYAFLLEEGEFDQAFDRLREAGHTYWADPGHHRPDEINTRNGGRGLYFDDPNGHNLEILTRP